MPKPPGSEGGRTDGPLGRPSPGLSWFSHPSPASPCSPLSQGHTADFQSNSLWPPTPSTPQNVSQLKELELRRRAATVCVHLKLPGTNHCFSTSSSISNRAGIFPQGPLIGRGDYIQALGDGEGNENNFLRPKSYKIQIHTSCIFLFFFSGSYFLFGSVGLSPLLLKIMYFLLALIEPMEPCKDPTASHSESCLSAEAMHSQ